MLYRQFAGVSAMERGRVLVANVRSFGDYPHQGGVGARWSKMGKIFTRPMAKNGEKGSQERFVDNGAPRMSQVVSRMGSMPRLQRLGRQRMNSPAQLDTELWDSTSLLERI